MLKLPKILRYGATALAVAVVSLSAHAAVIPVTTQLGFLIDASGSIGVTDFGIIKNGYSNALAALPVDGSIELTVVTFSTGTNIVVAPTVVNAVTLPGILIAINAMAYSAGLTNTAAGINKIADLMIASTNFALTLSSMINISTDGEPNEPGTVANAQVQAILAAKSAQTRGIDSLTAEAIGNPFDANFLRDIVFSPINGVCTGCGTLLADGSTPPNPMTSNPWVLRVNDFKDFPRAINTKVQVSIGNDVPEPGVLMLMSLGLVALGFTRRNKSTR